MLDGKAVSSQGYLGWIPIGVGLVALFGPTFFGLARTLWPTGEYAHGPVILAVAAWLIWQRRHALHEAPRRRVRAVAGVALVATGLLIYMAGRSQDITVLEMGSLIPILAGTLLAMRGPMALRTFWFPLVFLVFLVPLPEAFIDAITGTLKQHVSDVAERILYAADYPVGRSGVILTVGQYQMLVADACSGLNSMFSLSALALLYMYLVGRRSWLHHAVILVGTMPIAFAANVVRVLSLVLITYHFGDQAGQGFMHGAAGIVLVLAALALILCLDAALAWLIPKIDECTRGTAEPR
jgi:exosortase B